MTITQMARDIMKATPNELYLMRPALLDLVADLEQARASEDKLYSQLSAQVVLLNLERSYNAAPYQK